MDREGFEAAEQKRGLRRSLTAKAIKEVARFERFQEAHSTTLEEAMREDVESFLEERTMGTVATIDVHGLHRYFAYTGHEELAEATADLRFRFTPPFKLSELPGADPTHIEALASEGIRTNNQLLRKAPSVTDRAELAERIGVPRQDLETMSKLADLTRMFGVRAIRAKLYFEMGIETVEQMASWRPEDLVREANAFVERTGFDGIATLPKEAEYSVSLANRLPRLAAFD